MSSKHYRQFNNLPKEEPKSIAPVVVEPIKPTHDELHESLLWIQDMLERSSILFMVVGDIGKQIVENELPVFESDKLEILALKQHVTESGKSMLRTLLEQYYAKDIDWTEDRIKFLHGNVPIEITIVHNMYPFFMNPDFRYYTTTEFKVPNPFNSYWEERDHIA